VLAIAGFGAGAFVILPPTPVVRFTDYSRIDALAGRYFKAEGSTNLAAGLDLALGWITDQRAPSCRRVIVLTDGEANTGVDRLPALATRLKAAHATVSIIYVGSPSGANGVKLLAERTVGGTFASAADVADIARRLNVSAAPALRAGNNRRWLNVVLVDVSASMTERTPSGMRRIDGVPAAMKSWLALQRANHGQ
jgi:Mg-chelatase subunit ChlD